MSSGTHAVLVYDSQENKREVLLNHLGIGVNRAGLVYGYAEESGESVRKQMKRFGINAGHLEKKDQLAIKSTEELYFGDGRMDADRVIKSFADLAWEYRGRGLDGIRGAAEMSPFFRRGMMKELVSYERALHRKFFFPGRGICGYNLVELENSGHIDILMPIIEAHDVVFLTGPKGITVSRPDIVTEREVETVTNIAIRH
jgi:hypothetical protein